MVAAVHEPRKRCWTAFRQSVANGNVRYIAEIWVQIGGGEAVIREWVSFDTVEEADEYARTAKNNYLGRSEPNNLGALIQDRD